MLRYKHWFFGGLCGTVFEVKRSRDWDWGIEIFLGTIWEECKGDFNKFVKELFKVWLHEFLHLILRWEKAKEKNFPTEIHYFASKDEEELVEAWTNKLVE
jgi:hypothetical protein